jgi:hypothetical protein
VVVTDSRVVQHPLQRSSQRSLNARLPAASERRARREVPITGRPEPRLFGLTKFRKLGIKRAPSSGARPTSVRAKLAETRSRYVTKRTAAGLGHAPRLAFNPAPIFLDPPVGGAPLWSYAEIVMLHVAAAELPSQPGSLPAPRMIDHDGHDWSDWREEFGRRFSRVSPGMPVRVQLATGVREDSILTVARQLPADLLILAWSGVLEANRARTVRSICGVAPCPVLLVAGRSRGSIGRSLDAASAG